MQSERPSTHQVSCLFFEEDHEPYAKQRDSRVCAMAKKLGVRVSSHYGNTLHPLESYVAKAGGPGKMKPTYGSFQVV